MFSFKFMLPSVYGFIMSCLIIKEGLFNLNMNLVTWSLYIINVLIAFVLYKLGGLLDKCLGR